jgi:predicted RND superfamily exporter protein
METNALGKARWKMAPKPAGAKWGQASGRFDMANEGAPKDRGFGRLILQYRAALGIGLTIVTLVMLYWASHVKAATQFEDLFPAHHPNTELYREYRDQYGGAQTLILMLRVKHGDIFNQKTLLAIQNMTRDIDKLPGVNHNEVFSLASYRLLYARAVPGALISSPFMFPDVPKTQAGLDDLRNVVSAHREQLTGYVTPDSRGAMVIASFNDQALDYQTLFDGVQRIIDRNSDSNTTIYASGAVMFAAWGYHYLPRLMTIFVSSIVLMILLLLLSLGRRTGWWAPILTGLGSAVWGLGLVSLLRFNFDPIMLVIPLILTARDLGHGIQWQGRYYDELDRSEDKILAIAATTDAMIGPGVAAILANIAGIIFIVAGDIPVLRQIGIGGALWLAASLPMVFIFQPIIVSYLPRPRVREGWGRAADSFRRLYRAPAVWAQRLPLASGSSRTGVIALGLLLMVIGLASMGTVRTGYQVAGTPIYRQDAKVNRDTAEISQFIPTNIGWVVLETPNYPDPASNVGITTLRMADDLAFYLRSRGDAVAVLDFATIAEMPMNSLLHYGYPKYLAIPTSDLMGAELWSFFFGASAPDEPRSYFAHSPAMTSACIRLLLPDHSNARLTRLRDDLNYFVAHRVTPDPTLHQVKLRYLGGDAGLYQATDDVVAHLSFVNLALTLAAIMLISAVMFRSIIAGIIFAVAAVMANAIAFTYLNWRDIGLTADTIPLISLGIGLGISFAIYLVARIRDEGAPGLSLPEATEVGLRTTGGTAVSTAIVIVGGALPWVFSPMLFHNEMSLLLILLMVTNLLVGLLIVPSLIVWLSPRSLMGGLASGHAGRPTTPLDHAASS